MGGKDELWVEILCLEVKRESFQGILRGYAFLTAKALSHAEFRLRYSSVKDSDLVTKLLKHI